MDNINQVPANYVVAEVITSTPGFPYVQMEFEFKDGSTLKRWISLNIANNLERVAVN